MFLYRVPLISTADRREDCESKTCGLCLWAVWSVEGGGSGWVLSVECAEEAGGWMSGRAREGSSLSGGVLRWVGWVGVLCGLRQCQGLGGLRCDG